MKRLIVTSDSHGYIKNLKDALLAAALLGSVDAVAFLGDGADDVRFAWDCVASLNPRAALYVVKGNCDPRFDAPEECAFVLGKARFFACHGHQYGVKLGLERLCFEARDHEANVALYGHTHACHSSVENGLYVVNPGAVSTRFPDSPAYADVRVNDDGLVITEFVPWRLAESVLSSNNI